MKALLAQHSVGRPDVSDLYGREGMRWLEGIGLPVPDGKLLSEDISLIEMLGERMASTEGLIEELSRGDEAVMWLRSLPGHFPEPVVLESVRSIGAGAERPSYFCAGASRLGDTSPTNSPTTRINEVPTTGIMKSCQGKR